METPVRPLGVCGCDQAVIPTQLPLPGPSYIPSQGKNAALLLPVSGSCTSPVVYFTLKFFKLSNLSVHIAPPRTLIQTVSERFSNLCSVHQNLRERFLKQIAGHDLGELVTQ